MKSITSLRDEKNARHYQAPKRNPKMNRKFRGAAIKNKAKTLWLVNQYKSGEFPNIVSEFQGIFSSKKKAFAACHSQNYCIAPVKLDQELPEETITMPGAYYPLIEAGPKNEAEE